MGWVAKRNSCFTTMRCSTLAAALLSVGCLFSHLTFAATVTFSPSPAGVIADDSSGGEIANSEIYQFAWDAGASSPVTVNGVTFLGSKTAPTASGITITENSPLTLPSGRAISAAYTGGMFTLMDSAIASDGGSGFDLTLNGLTPGVPYRVQFLSGDTIASGGRTMQISSGGSSTEFFATAGLDDGTGRSRFVFANFTAAASTQLFRLAGDPDSRAFLNGIAVFAIPEPAGLSLLASCGLLALRRRR